jgi:ABC-type uncharacterized transport system substrate-binding protein
MKPKAFFAKCLAIALPCILLSCGGQAVKAADEKVYSIPAIVDAENRPADSGEANLAPFKKKDGSKFKVAVIQSGDYFYYADVVESIVQAFQTFGWIKERSLDFEGYPDGKTPLNIIKELASFDSSAYLAFEPDLYFDLKWDDANQADPKFKKIVSGATGADLIIGLGTQACQILAKRKDSSVPILVDGVSDPVRSGILASKTDSGKEFLTGVVDEEQNSRQVRLFHTVIGFKRLGLIYEDSEIGKTYAAYDDVSAVAKEAGFAVVPNTKVLPDPENEDDEAAWEACEAAYVKAVKAIAPKVDAIYLAVQSGLSDNSLPEIVKVLDAYKIPSFVMEGKDFVKHGVLLGESEKITAKGIYNAKKMVAIFRGAKPRSLNQIFEHVPHIAINLSTAAAIGYDVPIDILASADEIYLAPGAEETK